MPCFEEWRLSVHFLSFQGKWRGSQRRLGWASLGCPARSGAAYSRCSSFLFHLEGEPSRSNLVRVFDVAGLICGSVGFLVFRSFLSGESKGRRSEGSGRRPGGRLGRFHCRRGRVIGARGVEGARARLRRPYGFGVRISAGRMERIHPFWDGRG